MCWFAKVTDTPMTKCNYRILTLTGEETDDRKKPTREQSHSEQKANEWERELVSCVACSI